MATRYRFADNNFPHFITCTVVNWIDVFSREIYKEILIDSLTFCIKEKGLRLHVWAFPPCQVFSPDTFFMPLLVSYQQNRKEYYFR